MESGPEKQFWPYFNENNTEDEVIDDFIDDIIDDIIKDAKGIDDDSIISDDYDSIIGGQSN